METINIKIKIPFDNEIINLNVNKNNKIYKTITNYIIQTYKLHSNYFILDYYSKVINKNKIFKELENPSINKNYLELIIVQKGGGIFDGIIDVFNTIFNGLMKMVDGMLVIGEFLYNIPKLFIWIGNTFWWFLRVLGWILEIFSPVALIKDFVGSLITIVLAIIMVPINIFSVFLVYGTNTIGTMMSSVWGWDQSNLSKDDKNSDYFKKQKECKNKKCYLSQNNKVPFSILLGTIVCPPLGVFMEYGFTGWFNILICTILTLLFYFPGLFYALLIIYS